MVRNWEIVPKPKCPPPRSTKQNAVARAKKFLDLRARGVSYTELTRIFGFKNEHVSYVYFHKAKRLAGTLQEQEAKQS